MNDRSGDGETAFLHLTYQGHLHQTRRTAAFTAEFSLQRPVVQQALDMSFNRAFRDES